MKSVFNYTIIGLLLFTLVSCSKRKFLDRAPSVSLPEEQIFGDPALAIRYADNAYNHLIDDYARFNSHRGITGQFADEAVSANNDIAIRAITQGNYHDHYERGGESLNDIRDVWRRCYAGIRVTNVMLEKFNSVPWTAAYDSARIRGEMYFIRAYLNFELVKRFGGVPIADRSYGVNEDIDFPRNTYDECKNFILADLERAIALLPTEHNNSNYGRATKGSAMALKARMLLYAASKLNNEAMEAAKWGEAAAASKAIMDMNLYSLNPTYADLLNLPSSPEYIMIKIRPPRAIDGMMLDFVMSPGSGGIQGTLNPTQNHVDLYEMANGRPISDPTSGYNAATPYVGRDPRFYANILYNGAAWQSRTIQTYNGGLDYIAGNVTYSVTRYYCKRLWPEAYRRVNGGTALLNYVFFRFAETLLNYAEAQNEAVGPDASVYRAIDSVRHRAGMPSLPAGLSKDQMRARIRNERAVEFAFEDLRWYDIQRWKAGEEIVNQPVYGMDVVRNANNTFTYTRVLLPSSYQKVFRDYMHHYPIPRSEIYKSQNILLQNTGW